MPPRYEQFAKGRVLVGFNTSSQNVNTPWLKDPTNDVAISSDYWDNPAASDELGKELKDTFHEVFPWSAIMRVIACDVEYTSWRNKSRKSGRIFATFSQVERVFSQL